MSETSPFLTESSFVIPIKPVSSFGTSLHRVPTSKYAHIQPKTYTTDYAQVVTCFTVFVLGGSLTAGLVVLLLFMNGTLWPAYSTTNYQFNTTGTILFVLLLLVGLVVIGFICLYYLMVTGKPTFTVEDLEFIVKTCVDDATEFYKTDTDAAALTRAARHFKYDSHGVVKQKDLIEGIRMEETLFHIESMFNATFPHVALRNSDWCFNRIGGITPRQKMTLLHPKEYVCLWGTVLEQQGFSGCFPHLNEGDVMINGVMDSNDPESFQCIPRRYTFGQTSYLNNTTRRHFYMGRHCYMLSFGLYNGSNLLRTIFSALITPYLFEHNDWISFWVQICGFCRVTSLLVQYRLAGGGSKHT